jgi:hypothetical protein
LSASAGEEWGGGDKKRTHSLLGGEHKSRVDFARSVIPR